MRIQSIQKLIPQKSASKLDKEEEQTNLKNTDRGCTPVKPVIKG